MGACSLSPYFFSAPNKPKDLSKNQMCFENIFWLKKFFRTKGLTEDACWYNTVTAKEYIGSLGLLRVGMTLRRPLAASGREGRNAYVLGDAIEIMILVAS